MNIVGIVAEYNPMHNGHIYNINKAKELTNADYVVIIMSGSFTEQGNIATIDKFSRARFAIENGADIVLELPTIYAISSAENFAFGAINILNSLGIVTHLAFGAESDNICELKDIANTYINNKNEILTNTKIYLKEGISSASAYNKALEDFLTTKTANKSLPNNILAIEYLKSLIMLKSQIEPILIKRLESSHSDNKLPASGEYASSTAIRNILSDTSLSIEEKLLKIQNIIPENIYNYIANNSYNINENMWENLKYEIIKLKQNGLKNIYEVNEGLENKLYEEALKSRSYEEFIFNVKSKRYSLGRVKRICLYILLGITKSLYESFNIAKYARVLKVKTESSKLLSNIYNNATVPLITKVTDNEIKLLDEHIQKSINLDILANNIAFPNLANLDYTNKITQP